jgi:hypothetical protein
MTAETAPRNSEVPELTYGRNMSMPAASAALRLCQSPKKGRYMEATRDIKIGQCSSLISVHNNFKIAGRDKTTLTVTSVCHIALGLRIT